MEEEEIIELLEFLATDYGRGYLAGLVLRHPVSIHALFQVFVIRFQIVPLILLFWNRFDVYLRDKQETQERMKLKKLSKFD